MNREEAKEIVRQILAGYKMSDFDAYSSVGSKPEFLIRDYIARSLFELENVNPLREFNVSDSNGNRKRVDLSVVDFAGIPVFHLELKAMISKDVMAKTKHSSIESVEDDIRRVSEIDNLTPVVGVQIVMNVQECASIQVQREALFKYWGKDSCDAGVEEIESRLKSYYQKHEPQVFSSIPFHFCGAFVSMIFCVI